MDNEWFMVTKCEEIRLGNGGANSIAMSPGFMRKLWRVYATGVHVVSRKKGVDAYVVPWMG
eukprot:scaffold185824_cov47-Attheya_sp.AAC.2